MQIKIEHGRYGETKITFKYRGKKHAIFIPANESESAIKYLEDRYDYLGSRLWFPINRHIIPYLIKMKVRQPYVL